MANLAIIPARGGSKRIPRKNAKPFLGKPIIAYSIKVALNSELFDEVMVSTDDPEIAEIARRYGATVPFLRSQENANDHAVLADVVQEVLSDYKNANKAFNNVCCILPTAPFITTELLNNAFHKMTTEDCDSVFPVIEFSFPIQRSLKFNKGKIEMVWKEHLNARSQDLEARFHDAGQFYWIKTEAIAKEQKLYTNNASAIVISTLQAQDIDTETDWKLAELKYKLMLDEKDNNL